MSETVSDALDEPVDALPPLSDAIDTDGLDAVMADDGDQDVTITFSYAEMFVCVRSDSTVYVRPQRSFEERSPDTRI
ncbi:hypothetical protein DM2_1483 [Halorubrum sp. DM2]|nr:hypothetical protein DM2_1483 [Halorubrum sp. DM2]